MTEDHLSRWFACGRKRIYVTRKAAKTAANRLRRETGHKNIYAYQCPYDTRHWHVGHSTRKEHAT